jgi:hypothetical protein
MEPPSRCLGPPGERRMPSDLGYLKLLLELVECSEAAQVLAGRPFDPTPLVWYNPPASP